MSWEKYNSISSVPKNNCLLGMEVLVTEKVDGCNFSVRLEGDDFVYHSRNQKVEESDGGNFAAAIRLFEEKVKENPLAIQSCFANGETIYFELYGKGVQKRIDYCDDKRLAIIDVLSSGEYLSYQELERYSKFIGIEVIPSYGKFTLNNNLIVDIESGNPPFHESIISKLRRPEGCVVRPEREFKTIHGIRAINKIKSTAFSKKENSLKVAKKSPCTPIDLIEWADRVVDFDRLSSVYSHGDFSPSYSMKDMRELATLVPKDIKSEDHSVYSLYDDKMINRVICAKLPNVLRSFLEQQIE